MAARQRPHPLPCSLLGAGVDFGEQTDWGRWEAGLALDPAGLRPWLFVAQQKRLSLREMGIYEAREGGVGQLRGRADGEAQAAPWTFAWDGRVRAVLRAVWCWLWGGA